MRSDAVHKTGNELEPAADTKPDGDTVKPPKPSAIYSSAPTRRITAGTLLDRHQTVPNSVLDTSQKMSCAKDPSVLAGCPPKTASAGDGMSLSTSTFSIPRIRPYHTHARTRYLVPVLRTGSQQPYHQTAASKRQGNYASPYAQRCGR